MRDDFVHLHNHSNHSLLDGLPSTADMAARAVELNHSALALTDHGVMSGVIEFYRDCIKAGVKPIIGQEGYIVPFGQSIYAEEAYKDHHHHILMLAENMTGYQNIMQLSSTAQLDGFYRKPRIDYDVLERFSEGVIVTSGCMAGEIPSLLNPEKSDRNEDAALERLLWYRNVFGDRFYIEIQDHHIPALRQINQTLVKWAKQYQMPMIVTNDAHYLRDGDAPKHDLLLCVQTKSAMSKPDRMRLNDPGYYLKSIDEMRAMFDYIKLPDSAYTNTLAIAERCNVDLNTKGYHFPNIDIPEGYTYESYLEELAYEGAKKRYGSRFDSDEVQKRIRKELDIINGKGFAVYFLIVADICYYARDNGIWWNIRGSGAGSVVAYSLGITRIEPLSQDLIFERFLNPSRYGMPDFDLDFPDDKRSQLIEYTINRYGAEHVAQVATFNELKVRGALRDVGRALEYDLEFVNQMAKNVPATAKTLKDAFENQNFSMFIEENQDAQQIVDASRDIIGSKRSQSIHAAAVIVTPEPIRTYVPLFRSPKSAVTPYITQFEYTILESLGLLKIDFLGLATLSVFKKACELIEERHGIHLDMDNVPYYTEDAKPAFDLLSSGRVLGVFQVESTGMQRYLAQMKPEAFKDIIAMVALYRPGPMDNIPSYIARLHNEEEIHYRHPLSQEILAETQGYIVYQEQIMRTATLLAGYTDAEADNMRKAVSKKNASDLQAHQDKFIQGCIANKIKEPIANDIFADILKFANYGFCKAHAADYAMLTVQTAWLKAVYPVEYMAALLTYIKDQEDAIKYATDAQRMNIQVVNPDVNQSEDIFTIGENDEIVFGFYSIKNMSQNAIEIILDERRNGGKFQNLGDFCARLNVKKLGSRSIEALIYAGAFDSLCPNDNIIRWRHNLLASIQNMIIYSKSVREEKSSSQLSFWGEDAGLELELVDTDDLINPQDYYAFERETIGLFLSVNPLKPYVEIAKSRGFATTGQLNDIADGQMVRMIAIVRDFSETRTRKGQLMAFIDIEDMDGGITALLFGQKFDTYFHTLTKDAVFMIAGKVSRDNEGNPSIIVENLKRAKEMA